MQELIISLMDQYGYVGIFFLIAIENIFPPIPSEVILTLGGFMTTYTEMSVAGVILFSTFGSLLGAIILYYIGKILNKDRLMRIVEGKIGRILRLKAKDIEKSVEWFDTKGNKTVFFCRFVPILRSLISIPAGISGMHQGKFLLYTTVGSIIWNTVLVFLGSVVGESWETIAAVIDQYAHITLIVLVLGAALFIFLFYRKRLSRNHTEN